MKRIVPEASVSECELDFYISGRFVKNKSLQITELKKRKLGSYLLTHLSCETITSLLNQGYTAKKEIQDS